MTALIEFIDVFLRGLDFIALALTAGGVIVALAVLRPWQPLTMMGQKALERSAFWIAVGGGVLVAIQVLRLGLQCLLLTAELREWPITQFLETGFAQAGISRAMAGVVLTTVSWLWLMRRPTSLVAWIVLALCAGGMIAAGAWSVHGASRIDDRIPLMIITVLHQAAAIVWVGGIFHLLVLWRLLRGDLEVSYLWPRWLARCSPLALGSVIFLVTAGAYLGIAYVGSWQGLVGTGYGVMVIAKTILLALALVLAANNFSQVRQWRKQRQAKGILEKLPLFLGAEGWVLGIVLLLAATLTSLPPAVDTPDQQASFSEVVGHFMPRMPHLIPPSREEYSAAASSVFDSYAVPVAAERAQSNFNHNFSGVIVLMMALLALVDRSKYFAWARHWPLLFLGLAIFLFLFAASTVWPLGPESFWRTLQVPVVLQHRLLTVLVIALGLFEWRVRMGKIVNPRALLVFPWLCLVGGALLLTHSHTVFALKSEFLIEAHHAALGVLAVIMGIGRWLELRLAPSGGYGAGSVWRLSFVSAGVLLLFYFEPPISAGVKY
ncbi:copper resistance D family protein [Nitrosococcus watsonii]|uniref:Copper resistance protein D n=1 Tax=Nitrosococcus watsoni (strain C-113) TaxID=105559 RepID=D8K5W5_NITWC|nr:CopD family protein [Nitrosococcus watsonii]ADJ28292.1 copper resistance D domain protein [Nitrosococcus watsonii C-113]